VDRTERFYKIQQLINRHKVVPARRFRDELEISPATFKRDLEYLRSRLNIPIYPGDVVQVRPADVVYVVGAVNKPGAYPMPGNERLTAMRALALGQGFGPAASQSKALVVRTGPNGQRIEIPVNLKAVLKGKTLDVPLQAHDVLFVPTSGGKVAGREALDAFLRVFAWRPTGW
jgi:protein involved in polysaccharide export with SLBB domain